MKKIVREIIAMLIFLAAIVLVLIMFFFDYIKTDSNQPQAATYKMSEEEKEILKEKAELENSQNKIVLTSGYTVTESELQEYKASGELKTGQTNPFDETPITDVLYDGEGNAYYKVINNRSEVTTSSNQWYGTVSGDSRGITTTNVTTSNGTTAISTKDNSTQTPATTTPITSSESNIKSVPSSTPKQSNNVYDPVRDITAPSTDSGNLSQATGKK